MNMMNDKVLDLRKAGNSKGPSHVKLQIAKDEARPVALLSPEQVTDLPVEQIDTYLQDLMDSPKSGALIQAALEHELKNGKRMVVVGMLQKALIAKLGGADLNPHEVRKIANAAGVRNDTVSNNIEETPGEKIVITKDGAKVDGKPFTSTNMKNKYVKSKLPMEKQTKIWSDILG
jgi:hypothetical protein